MSLKFNTFEGGTNGATIATTDTGSGDSFDLVTIGAASTATYDSAFAKNGSRGLTIAATAVTFTRWVDTASASVKAGTWFKMDAAPSTATQGPILFRTSGSTSVWRIQMGTNRTLTVQGSAGTVGIASAALTVGNWYYLDVYAPNTSTTVASVLTCDIYDATGALVSSIGGSSTVSAGTIAQVEWGTRNASTWTIHFDDPRADIGSGTPFGFPDLAFTRTDTATLTESSVQAQLLAVAASDSGTLTDTRTAFSAALSRTDSASLAEAGLTDQPAYVDGASFDSAGSTVNTFTLTQPGTVPLGAFGFLLATWVNGAGEPPPITVTASSGVGNDWTTLDTATSGTSGFTLMSRVLTAGDSTTITVTYPVGAQRFSVAEVAWYRNVQAVVASTIGNRSGVSSSVVTLPAMTVSSGTHLVLLASMERTTAAGTVISSLSGGGITRRFSEGTGSSTTTAMIGDRQVTTTSVSATTVTYNSASGNGAGLMVDLQPGGVTLDQASTDSAALTESSLVSATAQVAVNDAFSVVETSSEILIVDTDIEGTLTDTSVLSAGTASGGTDSGSLTFENVDSITVTAELSDVFGLTVEFSQLTQLAATFTLRTTRVASFWRSPAPSDRERLFYKIPVAASLARVGGVWVDVSNPSEAFVNAAEVFFGGGREFDISPELRTELVAAGYGDLISQKETDS